MIRTQSPLRAPTADEVLVLRAAEVVAAEFRLSADELLGAGRERPVAEARHALVLLLRDLSHWSFLRLSGVLRHHHTNTLHSAKRARELCEIDARYAARVRRARAALLPVFGHSPVTVGVAAAAAA